MSFLPETSEMWDLIPVPESFVKGRMCMCVCFVIHAKPTKSGDGSSTGGGGGGGSQLKSTLVVFYHSLCRFTCRSGKCSRGCDAPLKNLNLGKGGSIVGA